MAAGCNPRLLPQRCEADVNFAICHVSAGVSDSGTGTRESHVNHNQVFKERTRGRGSCWIKHRWWTKVSIDFAVMVQKVLLAAIALNLHPKVSLEGGLALHCLAHRAYGIRVEK